MMFMEECDFSHCQPYSDVLLCRVVMAMNGTPRGHTKQVVTLEGGHLIYVRTFHVTTISVLIFLLDQT